ncbi:MAG: hypothetical protein AAB401_07780 [Acidobacteriota bacterium]
MLTHHNLVINPETENIEWTNLWVKQAGQESDGVMAQPSSRTSATANS